MNKIQIASFGILAFLVVNDISYAAPIFVSVGPPHDNPRLGVTRLELFQEGSRLSCRTKTVPEHEVRLPWLKDLSPPAFLSVLRRVDLCPRSVLWGSARRCALTPDDQKQVDALIRRCTQI